MNTDNETIHHADHHLRIARRVEDLSGSSIFRINIKAHDLTERGQDILRLDAGEPDFDTPKSIIDAAKQALDDGFTRYTPIDGLPGLKASIQYKLKRDNNLHYNLDEIMHTCGAKQALFNACMTLLNPMDEIVIPTPNWGTYPSIANIAWARIVEAPTRYDEGFVLQPDVLEKCLSDRTRVIILNTPNNPTGQVYSREALSALGNVLLKYPDVIVLSDDIYEHLRYTDEPFVNILNVCPSLKDRTVVINGVSKAYAMTGWRVGFAAGPAQLIAEMQKLQGESTSHTAAVSQKAAEAAFNGNLDDVHKMVKAFSRRAKMVADGLSKIDAIDCHPAQGSFYCLPNFERVIGSLDGVDDDQQFGDWLLEELGIAMVPGSAFNAPGHMRLSFAASDDTLRKGLERLQKAFG
ncbi:MAG TPA: pyridoxal phosphate-dependent aminotransferase [Marinobacter sp.]|uniref:Aminotransferase n=2 Tax=root TaxID=1 RepID=A0A831W0F0_9GAMM|nr:pyridoxal phosphate-dependent aminotransferase [Marinobacter antarcticus]HDZ37261.1 pyridoxal phosphate-dependent aminotransferase [Marinobacter sp.]HEA53370.1 pyridoxal phosphate-dependent aminotransferase [Marinobacter antarcticus]